MTVGDRINVLASLAEVWQDPDHEARAASVQAMLEGEGRFTEEGLAFALNHRMHQFSGEAVSTWLGGDPAPKPRTVGITPAALDPLGGLDAAVAALVLGHDVVVEAPTLPVAAFLDDLADAIDGEVRAASRTALLNAAEAWVVRYTEDQADEVERDLESIGLPDSHVDAIRVGASAVVLDGREDQEMLSGLAEDVLLHEGLASGTPRVIWAPAGTSPDALLNALAGFRELYPAHPDTDGTLALPTAFLSAAKQPHATGPGFLVSLGDPEPQTPGHIRWAEYDTLGDVDAWAKAVRLARLIAEPHVANRLDVSIATVLAGDAHRPGLDRDLPGFLRSL